MTDKVLEYVKQKTLIQAGDRIVAGFSGGADSVCLLLMLQALLQVYDFSFCAVHVEHGIRGEESLRDAGFARRFCSEHGIALKVYGVDAPARAKEKGMSLEEAARELRYECFEAFCREWGGTKIAVAHHADDNAETVLFHMCRGTGIRGMRGIRPARDHIIRPLLCVTRCEIEDYLQDVGVSYCTDSTNEELAYSRNRIRKNVIPELTKINEKSVEHIARLAENMEEVCEYLDAAAWEAGKGCVQSADGTRIEKKGAADGIRIDKKGFGEMHPVLQKHFLYQILAMAAGNRKDIASIHVDSLRQVFSWQAGKTLDLPYGLWAIAEYDFVSIGAKSMRQDMAAKESPLTVNGGMKLPDGLLIQTKVLDFCGNYEKIQQKKYTKWFDYDKIINTVLVRKRRSGDYLTVTSKGDTKKLKDYFINEKIPRMRRDQIWLLADGPHIMWVIGYRMSAAYKVTPQTKRILEVRVYKGEDEYERIDTCDVHRGTGQ